MGSEMNDGLNELLRQRFAAHEMPAPQDAWSQISGKLAAHADGSQLRESLQEKFNGHEVHVDPSAWANIRGRIGSAGATSTYRWIAAGLAAAAIGAFFLWNNGETPVTPPQHAETVAVPTVVPVPAKTATTEKPAVEESTPVENVKENVQPVVSQAKPAAQPSNVEQPAITKTTEPSVPAASPLFEEPAPQQHETIVPVPEPERAVKVPTAPAPVVKPEPVPEKAAAPAKAEQSTTSDPPAENQPEDKPEPPVAETPFDIYIPSAFTVNGDGVNDKLRIVAEESAAVDVRIATISGAEVFNSNDLARMWDGRMPNGNIAPDGMYRCVVAITDLRGAVHYKTEVVRLFR
jgi:hypothetical protein